MCEGGDALGTAVANFSCHAHQVAYDRHTGRMGAGAAAVIKRIRAILPSDPDRVVRASNAREDRALRNQGRTHGEDYAGWRLARRANQADGVMQQVGVFKIDWADSPDAFGVDIRWLDSLTERQGREDRQFRA